MSLFTQVLECHLDAFVIEGLKVAAKLVAATCGAIEKLAYPANRRVRLTFEGGRAPNVDRAIEIEIVDILIGLADQRPRSVCATMFRRFSGYGIFTPEIRLMTIRTCSRSAAVADVRPAPITSAHAHASVLIMW